MLYYIIFIYTTECNNNNNMLKRLIPGEPKCEGGIGQESCSIRAHLQKHVLFRKHNHTSIRLSSSLCCRTDAFWFYPGVVAPVSYNL